MSKKERDSGDWREQLIVKYPRIFKGSNDDPYQGGSLVGFGICCGDGWKSILETLCKRLTYIADNKGIVCVAAQIKEKFAGLRFYYDVEIDEEAVIVKKKWWKPLLDWFSFYRRWWWRPKFLNKIRVRNQALWRLKGISYLQMLRDGEQIANPSYIDFSQATGEISGIVSTIESLSYRTCETCGNPGKYNDDEHWIVTICDECDAKRKQAKAEDIIYKEGAADVQEVLKHKYPRSDYKFDTKPKEVV